MTENRMMELLNEIVKYEEDSSRKAHAKRLWFLKKMFHQHGMDGLEADEFA